MTALVPITSDNWRRAAGISAAGGQLRFVAAYEPVALVILSKAFVRAGNVDWWPYLIEDAGRAVGVVALVDERQLSGELALFDLLVDASQQGRGYGRAAVRRAVELARKAESCDRLRLTVHPANQSASTLYQSEGFVVDGVDAEGEIRRSFATPERIQQGWPRLTLRSPFRWRRLSNRVDSVLPGAPQLMRGAVSS